MLCERDKTGNANRSYAWTKNMYLSSPVRLPRQVMFIPSLQA
jgi:hypothetical protein